MIGFKTWDEVLAHVAANKPLWYQDPLDLYPVKVETHGYDSHSYKRRIRITFPMPKVNPSVQVGKEWLDRFRKPDMVFEGILIDPKPWDPKSRSTTKQSGEYWLMGQSQSSAYAHKPNCFASGMSWDNAIEELAQGGYVVDKRHLDYEVACEVISSPLDNPELGPLTLGNMGSQPITFASFDQFFEWVENRIIQRRKENPQAGPGLSMAYLSLDLYAEWWRRRGAKVGRKINGEIYWKAPWSGPLFEPYSTLNPTN